jgi:Ni,Fe-hydrogenase III large subunit
VRASDLYLKRISELVADGGRFAGLYATSDKSKVRTLLTLPDGTTHLETVSVVNGEAPSIVPLVPAAAWDERESHDLYGVNFVGHQPLRPLIRHDKRVESWTLPVEGTDSYQVAVGPIHAGVIESGHFRFHVVGDRILYLDARLFYKHRGLEQAAEGAELCDGLRYVVRACAGCAVANTVAYAHACEQALGCRPTPELARIRTILLELERVWNHLNDIAAICSGVGFAVGNNYFAALTEQARRLNKTLTGHRFLFDTIRHRESQLTLSSDQIAAARSELQSLHQKARMGWRELCFNSSLQDRLPDIGVLDLQTAARLGAVGPAARSAGISEDVRSHSEQLTYEDFEPVVLENASGDVKARLDQRALELWQSFTLLGGLLTHAVEPSSAEEGKTERDIGVGRVESSRGATTCVVERDGNRISRLHLRTGSYANWPVLAHTAIDNLLPDFPLINKSFELCYACTDR